MKAHTRSAYPLTSDELILEHREALTRALAKAERGEAWWRFVAIGVTLLAVAVALALGVFIAKGCP